MIRAYGVADRRYGKDAQLEVESSGQIPVYGLAYASVFVLSPKGIVRWRFVSEHEELRLTAGSILHRSVGRFVDQSPASHDGGRVRVETTASDTSAGLGSRLTLGVALQIPPGWHVYSPQVKGGYHGISWRMNSSECSIIGDTEWPEPRWEQPAFAAERLPEYEGTVRFTRELIIRPMISNGSAAVWQRFRQSCLEADSSFVSQGSLDFQTCTDRECLPPQSVPLKWKFVFVPPDRRRVPVDDWRVFEH